jgi:general secretion pathway protein G
MRRVTFIESGLIFALLAVLATVALPMFQDCRERVLRAHAVADIVAMQALIRNFELENRALPASLADVGQGGRLDPWGRPCVYVDVSGKGGQGKARKDRKDRKLNLLNSDFDLYSVGRDGVTHSQASHKDSADDVLRALDGEFVGVGADVTR